jgi:hypothetical protein
MKVLARLLLAVVGASFVLSLVACGNQAEGERCDKLNSNADCESPLVCTPFTGTEQGQSYAVCCPSNPLTSTASACIVGATTGGGGSGGSAGSAGAPADASSDLVTDSAEAAALE